MTTTDPHLDGRWRPNGPLDLRLTLSVLRHGARDPTFWRDRRGVTWRTTLTPEGPATMALLQRPDGEVEARAWGTGRSHAIEHLPDLVGARDPISEFEPIHPSVQASWATRVGLRVPRTGNVLEALVPAILEQQVVGSDATASWHALVRAFGSPAPGPVPEWMRVAPDGATWRRVPSWELHRAGVDSRRARLITAVAAVAEQLQGCATLDLASAERRLTSIRGIGPWTHAEVARRALGDADCVSVGDYHLKNTVGFALTGAARTDDATMLELLEPWRGHRQRVVRLLELTFRAPAFGPRMPKLGFRRTRA